jgi:glutamate-1-semialdehyde 2,1-aminomutase
MSNLGGPKYDSSIALHQRASSVLPGGVNSNFRLGATPVPLFWRSGSGAHLTDSDGNDYIDYVLGMGPAILGHANPAVNHAVVSTLAIGQLLAGQTDLEVELAELMVSLIPSAEMVRLASSGSEAVQLALRLARAATGRNLVLKFEGHYHGWFDSILVSSNPPLSAAGPAEAPLRVLQSAGQSPAAASDIHVLPWNDLEAVRRFIARHGRETAAIILEPILCNTSVVLPRAGYLELLRELCDEHGIVLIFDEVITGFRVAAGGAQSLLGVMPDLTTLAKALGGGFPIAAVAGRRSLMELTVANAPVVHGGTYNSNLVSTAAALECLRILSADGGHAYDTLYARGDRLMHGFKKLGDSSKPKLQVQGLGPVFSTYFADAGEVVDFRSYQATDLTRQRAFIRALQDRGVRVTARGTWFLSTAHTESDIDATIAAAESALRVL